MKRKMYVPMELKAVGDTGAFSGYASIFGNVDLGGDVISKDEPFKEFVTNPDGKVAVLFQHDSGGGWGSTPAGGMPIALADVSQNSKGLKFDANLVMEDEFVAKRVYPALKAKTMSGMSIGFDIQPGGFKILESGIRELNALKLWEISLVTFGMNPKAGVNSVKSMIDAGGTVRDIEFYLRDAGFSRAEAKSLLSGGWAALQSLRDAGDDAEEVSPEVKQLSAFLKTL